MITIQEVQTKVKEIFPKLHDGGYFHYNESLMHDHIILVVRNSKVKSVIFQKGLVIKCTATEKEILVGLDNLINETYKIYWG